MLVGEDFEFAIGCISILGSWTIILTFLFLKELRKHPFSLVFYLSVSDFIFVAVVLCKAAFKSNLCFTEEKGFCIGTFVLHIFAMASVTWGACISVKLAVNTLRPFASTSTLEKWMHGFVWSISIFTAFISYLRQDGSIDADRCGKGGAREHIHAEFYVPVGIYFFMSCISFVLALTRMRTLAQAERYRTKIMLRLSLYVVAIPICWLGPLVYRVYLSFTTVDDRDENSCEVLNHWKSISLAAVGFINASIWLSTPDFLQAIKSRVKRLCLSGGAHEYEDVMPAHDDVNQMSIVLRNNMLTCSLLGIRESLRRLALRKKHQDPKTRDQSPPPRPSSPYGSYGSNNVLSAQSGRELWSESESDIEAYYSPLMQDTLDESTTDVAMEAAMSAFDRKLNLRRGHYFQIDKFSLDPQRIEKINDVLLFSSPFIFETVAPKVFHNIRQMNNISVVSYMKTMSPTKFLAKVLESPKFADGGRSGSFFCFSPDGKYIIKTIPEAEFNAMIKILPWYYEHLTKYPKSLLLHTPLYVVVMSNLFAGGDAPHIVYDLKGSWIDRRAGRGASVLKDNDLDYKFKVGAVKKAALMKQLTEDSKLLRDLKIMDYSLLVGVVQKYEPELAGKSSGSRRKGVRSKKSPSKATSTATPASPSSGDDSSGSVGDLPDINVSAEPDTSTTASLIKVGISDDRIDRITSMDGSQQYYFGVIDILQPFDGSKKLEACFKVFFMRKNPDGISAVEPNKYSRRFRKALGELLD